MDYLREGIHLRGFAQIEPLVAYKNEAFELFRDLMNSAWGDFARLIFHVEVTLEDPNGAGPSPAPPTRARPNPARSSATGGGRVSYSGGATAGSSAMAMAAAGADPDTGGPGGYGEDEEEIQVMPVVEQRRVDHTEQVGRNDPCWCGSGKKFKKCHGA
jgi:preprotein translocase subunit SecA